MITAAVLSTLALIIIFCMVCSSLAKDVEKMSDGVRKLTPRVDSAVQRFNKRMEAFSDMVNKKVAADKARREAAKALANQVTKPHKKTKP